MPGRGRKHAVGIEVAGLAWCMPDKCPGNAVPDPGGFFAQR